MPGIFISYRRQDGAPWAGRIYDWLTNHWGREHVFMDIDTIAPGEDFRVAITKTLTECDVALIVIGPRWLTVVDESGARRLDDVGDVHRTEVVSALSRDDVRVIPVLVGEAVLPRFSDLPEPLQPLIYRNAAMIDDRRFGADMYALNESLVGLAARLAAEREAAEGAAGRQTVPEELDRTQVLPMAPGPAAEPGAEPGAVVPVGPPTQVEAPDPSREPGPGGGRPVSPLPPLRAEPPVGAGADDGGARRRRRMAAWWGGAAVALVVVLIVVVLALARGGGGPGVEVSGREPWTPTDVQLAIGDRLIVEASGTVYHNDEDPRTQVGPNGASDTDTVVSENSDLNKPDLGVYVKPPGHGGLVGRIGPDGVPFGVGEHYDKRVTTAGRLYLGINENFGDPAKSLSNNSGQFSAEVRVVRA